MLDEFAQRVARVRAGVVWVLQMFLKPGNLVSDGISPIRLR
jgi:hypothetical protein